MRLLTGIFLGAILTAGSMALFAQPMFHPRIRTAIEHLRDAKAYMEAAPHDFGGHRVAAIRATDAAIREMEICARYRP